MKFTENGQEVLVDVSNLLEDNVEGRNDFKVTWYCDRYYKTSSTTGTFRSIDCAKIGHFSNDICCHCEGIPKLQSFRKRALLRQKKTAVGGERNTQFINNKYLNSAEANQKLQKQKEQIERIESQLFFVTKQQLHLKLRRRTLQEKVAEFASRGSLKGVCQQLIKADMEGRLSYQDLLVQMLQTVANNFNKKKQGQRYKSSVQQFCKVLLLWGGPRLAQFVAMNLAGPEIHSVFRWRKSGARYMQKGLSKENFVNVSCLYGNVSEKVPVLLSEDETAIVGSVQYVAERDVLTGFCGEAGPFHQCQDLCEVAVLWAMEKLATRT